MDHPGLFLNKAAQAYEVCRAVNSPSCKILFDIYHQQKHEGNLIPNIDRAWNEIAYFQVGDNPGRNEPTTGEINYLNLFRHIHSKSTQMILGMEHGNSKPGKEGERAVIEAYRKTDQFMVQ
jgi:hydroxypyruvate isomerase